MAEGEVDEWGIRKGWKKRNGGVEVGGEEEGEVRGDVGGGREGGGGGRG